MNYGYVRVSTINQNINRQIEEMYKLNLTDETIFVDRLSGKDFERPNYQLLKRKLKKDDLLIIKSIDRLGRNYNMIIEEWSDITKSIEANIFVIDMPLLDTRVEGKNLVGKFISDIVLQILSFVAETERDNIRQRQAEGIRIAREKGVHLGRPKYILPDNFEEIAKKFKRKEITNVIAAKILNMNRGTFLKYVKQYKIK
ncbi:MAG: recombinase family protein [Bacilli bacterium]|nr:recombinase family protein [Bacilli bacterium]